MIFCNLKVLLAQRGISISKMSTATGISRTTLTALCTNRNGGIQFDTLDSICSYLNVSPNEFLTYSPYDFNLKRYGDFLEIQTTILLNHITFRTVLMREVGEPMLSFDHITGKENYDEDEEFDSYDYDKIEQISKEEEQCFRRFQSIVQTLPKCYITYLNEQIENLFADSLGEFGADFFSIETSIY